MTALDRIAQAKWRIAKWYLLAVAMVWGTGERVLGAGMPRVRKISAGHL
jgi:hypothetical protein